MGSGESEPRYPYVAIEVTPEESDEASAELFEWGCLGVEERDATTLKKGASAGKVTLVASFASHEEAEAAIIGLPTNWSPRLEEVIGDAWRDEWKKHFHPFSLCAGIVVVPPWERYEQKPGETILELEPGRAFGTGLHETTSLVARALANHAEQLQGQEVLDVGTGSGILSLVALVLGAKSARAIDIDAEAVSVTKENAARNKMSDRVTADTADVAGVPGAYPVVVANIRRGSSWT